jgi:hypothetical protein
VRGARLAAPLLAALLAAPSAAGAQVTGAGFVPQPETRKPASMLYVQHAFRPEGVTTARFDRWWGRTGVAAGAGRVHAPASGQVRFTTDVALMQVLHDPYPRSWMPGLQVQAGGSLGWSGEETGVEVPLAAGIFWPMPLPVGGNLVGHLWFDAGPRLQWSGAGTRVDAGGGVGARLYAATGTLCRWGVQARLGVHRAEGETGTRAEVGVSRVFPRPP